MSGWPLIPFEKAAVPQSDRGKRLKQRDYLAEGLVPVIDQGQAPVGGYTNDEDSAFVGDLPVVLFGDHTRAVKLVQHRFAVGADGIKIFKPAEGVRVKYLYYWMRSARLPDRGYGRHYQYLRALSIPLPQPQQQDEIVAEIEKQFSRLDEAVANLKRVKANLKRYKAAVLKASVEGRLVPTEAELARRAGRSFETGAQLLQRILETRRSKWSGKGRYEVPTAPNVTDFPELPEGWTWVPFGILGEDPFKTVQTGPFGAQLHNTEFTSSGVPVIAVGNLTGTGFRNDGLYFIDTAKADQLSRYDVWAGDLLFARSGATLGKVCVAPAAVQNWRMTGHILRARLNRQFIVPEVAVYSLAALPAVRSQVFGNVRGVTRPGFNTSLLESILIPVPPLPEQQRIVAEVDRRLSLIGTVEAEVDTNLKRAERLRQSVLVKAFSGELPGLAGSA